MTLLSPSFESSKFLSVYYIVQPFFNDVVIPESDYILKLPSSLVIVFVILFLPNINLIPVCEYNCRLFPPTVIVPVVILGFSVVPTCTLLVDLSVLNKTYCLWLVCQ
jgi:hypothetical protein